MFGLPIWASLLVSTLGFPLFVEILSMIARRTEDSESWVGEIVHIICLVLAQHLPSYSGVITKGQMMKKLGK